MVRRILLIVASVFAAVVVLAAPAGAQPYPGCTATVTDTTPDPGQTITVNGEGAPASSAVSASLDGAQVGSGTSSAAGIFSFPATIPSTASGTETLSIDCGTNGVLGLTLTVNPAATTTTAAVAAGDLPRTGSSSTLPMAQVGAAVLLLGGGALALARYRTRLTES